jgi:hypothetical protein
MVALNQQGNDNKKRKELGKKSRSIEPRGLVNATG